MDGQTSGAGSFSVEEELIPATEAGRALIDSVDREFMEAARERIGREPSADELRTAIERHLFQRAMALHYGVRRRGATDAQADAVRDAFLEGAHAALLTAGPGLQ